MTREDFNAALARLQRAATTVRVGLERGGIQATPQELATIKGIARGVKRTVINVQRPGSTTSAVQVRDAVRQRVVTGLPGWDVQARFNDTGELVLGLTRKLPLGPLTGCAVYGTSIDDLERAARALEEHLRPPARAAA